MSTRYQRLNGMTVVKGIPSNFSLYQKRVREGGVGKSRRESSRISTLENAAVLSVVSVLYIRMYIKWWSGWIWVVD